MHINSNSAVITTDFLNDVIEKNSDKKYLIVIGYFNNQMDYQTNTESKFKNRTSLEYILNYMFEKGYKYIEMIEHNKQGSSGQILFEKIGDVTTKKTTNKTTKKQTKG